MCLKMSDKHTEKGKTPIRLIKYSQFSSRYVEFLLQQMQRNLAYMRFMDTFCFLAIKKPITFGQRQDKPVRRSMVIYYHA